MSASPDIGDEINGVNAQRRACPIKLKERFFLALDPTDGHIDLEAATMGIECDLGCLGPAMQRRQIGRVTLPHFFDTEACRSPLEAESIAALAVPELPPAPAA